MWVERVLGGGGARRFAQIGALQALEDHGVQVTTIAAHSMATFISAFYAVGHDTSTVYELVKNVDQGALLNLEGGLSGHEGREALLGFTLPQPYHRPSRVFFGVHRLVFGVVRSFFVQLPRHFVRWRAFGALVTTSPVVDLMLSRTVLLAFDVVSARVVVHGLCLRQPLWNCGRP